MAGALADLYMGQPATTDPAAIVFTAANKVLIKEIVVTNTGATLAHLEIYTVAAGGAAAVGNALLYKLPFKPRSVTIFKFDKVIANTAVIRARQDVAGLITLHITGVTSAP